MSKEKKKEQEIEAVPAEELDEAIQESLDKGFDSVKAMMEQQAEKYEAQIEEIQAKMDEQARSAGEVEESLKQKLTETEKTLTGLKERQDAYEKKAGRLGMTQNQTFSKTVHESIKENHEQLKRYKEDRRQVSIDLGDITPKAMSRKAAIDMTQTDSLTGDVIPATRVPGVQFDPERVLRIRQLLPQGTTSSNAVWYVEETSYDDGTDITAEGASKPQSSFTLEQKAATVVKIASYFKISEEMLEDVDGLSSHISLRGTSKYFNKEDQQLLYGTGESGQITGLTVSATDYALGEYTGDANAQEFDILMQGIKQLRNDNYMPSVALTSINDFFQMIQRKDTDGRYLMPQNVLFGTQVPTVSGVPIIASNAVTDDDFLIADMAQLTTLFDRRGVSVRFFDQNQDDPIKNMVTVVIEARLALPTYLPDAGRYGTFDSAIQNAGNS